MEHHRVKQDVYGKNTDPTCSRDSLVFLDLSAVLTCVSLDSAVLASLAFSGAPRAWCSCSAPTPPTSKSLAPPPARRPLHPDDVRAKRMWGTVREGVGWGSRRCIVLYNKVCRIMSSMGSYRSIVVLQDVYSSYRDSCCIVQVSVESFYKTR